MNWKKAVSFVHGELIITNTILSETRSVFLDVTKFSVRLSMFLKTIVCLGLVHNMPVKHFSIQFFSSISLIDLCHFCLTTIYDSFISFPDNIFSI